MTFNQLDKDQLKDISSKGGKANRSPALQSAWANAASLKRDFYELGKSASVIASEYNINIRMVYRIIRGK